MHTISRPSSASRATTLTYRTRSLLSTKSRGTFVSARKAICPAKTVATGFREHEIRRSDGLGVPPGIRPAIRRPVPRGARRTLETDGALVKSARRPDPSRHWACALLRSIRRGQRPRTALQRPENLLRNSSRARYRAPGGPVGQVISGRAVSQTSLAAEGAGRRRAGRARPAECRGAARGTTG